MSTPDRGFMLTWTKTTAYVLLLVAIAITVRLPLLVRHQAIDDEVNYSVVTRQLMDGGLLYQDVVERRPPATFWVYRVVFRMFGPANWFALHAAATVWALLTMLALYALGARLFGQRTGYAAALLYAVYQPWWYWSNLAFNGEVLMNLPVAAAFAVCLPADRPRAVRFFLAGALVASAFLLKQPAAIAIVPLLLYAVHPARGGGNAVQVRERVRDMCLLAAGSATVLMAMAAWLRAHDVLWDSLYWSIFDHDVPHIFWGRALERTLAFLAVTFPMLAAGGWAIVASRAWSGRRAERDTLVCLLIVSAAGAAASGRFFAHYYIGILPALCVLAAAAVSVPLTAWTGRARWFPSAAIAWTICVTVATFLNQSMVGARQVERSEAGLYIRDHSDVDARLFVWGRTPLIYLDSERRPAARYIDTFALTGRIFGPSLNGIDTSARIEPGAWDQLKQDFDAHPPTFIVDADAMRGAEYPLARFPWLSDLLRREYTAVATTEDGIIYRKMDPAAVARAE